MALHTVPIVEEILSANDRIAQQNRATLDATRTFGINIMASPGAGKTSFILQTISALHNRLRLGVIEGDTAPVTIDADKIAAAGMPAVQINTGGNCHLEAGMVTRALAALPLESLDLVIVENVGNLICPASFALGTHINLVIASVPEGDDKPYKYPGIYRGIDVLILNKIDLMPYVDFDQANFERGIRILNPDVQIFPLSSRTGDGFDGWITWLEQRMVNG
jgi:hydrogenase nickel incorporation protein HypB